MSNSCFQRIYEIVKKIPRGKVMTYGQIATELKIQSVSRRTKVKISARVVGWALHANKELSIPCHRVVNKEGRLAPGYAFGGASVQGEKLQNEGVVFKDKIHVDLIQSLWGFERDKDFGRY